MLKQQDQSMTPVTGKSTFQDLSTDSLVQRRSACSSAPEPKQKRLQRKSISKMSFNSMHFIQLKHTPLEWDFLRKHKSNFSKLCFLMPATNQRCLSGKHT